MDRIVTDTLDFVVNHQMKIEVITGFWGRPDRFLAQCACGWVATGEYDDKPWPKSSQVMATRDWQMHMKMRKLTPMRGPSIKANSNGVTTIKAPCPYPDCSQSASVGVSMDIQLERWRPEILGDDEVNITVVPTLDLTDVWAHARAHGGKR